MHSAFAKLWRGVADAGAEVTVVASTHMIQTPHLPAASSIAVLLRARERKQNSAAPAVETATEAVTRCCRRGRRCGTRHAASVGHHNANSLSHHVSVALVAASAHTRGESAARRQSTAETRQSCGELQSPNGSDVERGRAWRARSRSVSHLSTMW